MFFTADATYKTSNNTELTLADLQAAIDKFAADHEVTPDIFFELLFVAATDYFIEEYAERHKT